jgi:hypothetical protein
MQILPFFVSSKVFKQVFSLFIFIKAVLKYYLYYINRYCQLNHSGAHDLRASQSIGISVLYCLGKMCCTNVECVTRGTQMYKIT